MHFKRVFCLASFAAVAVYGAPSKTVPASISCTDLTIPALATASSISLPANLTQQQLNTTSAVESVLASAPTIVVSTSYNIAARYCEPTTQQGTRDTALQLLVHDITQTKDYWYGLAPPGSYSGQTKYSWVEYAAAQGYPTLSFDRPCNGDSTYPTDSADCQMPLNVAVAQDIIAAARGGTLPGISSAFSKIIYVGHSWGSLMGSALSHHDPTGIDTYVLTAFSEQTQQGAPAALLLPRYRVAATAEPSKFGDLSGDLQYSVATNRSGIKTLYWAGDYKNRIFHMDYADRSTTAIGETLTAGLGQRSVPEYPGQVFVLNGNLDVVNCSPTNTSALEGQQGDCSDGFTSGVQAYYPNASAFSYYNVANTGNNINLHETAQEAFQAAHNWLAQVGY